jgi:predicted MFS family arabinose efflux permease
MMAAFGLFGGQGEQEDGTLYPFTWMFQFVFSPLQATMFSLLAFYVASASYRAFRVRNVEATLLLIGALIIMVVRSPLGALIHPLIPDVAEWVMQFPNAAAQRGIIIGAALGAASMSVRVMVGIERPYMGKS